MKSSSDSQQEIITGIAASPGICIGKAYLVDTEGVEVIEKYRLPEDRLTDEIKRFKAAVRNAEAELRAIIAETGKEFNGQQTILETHEVLLKDKMLYGRTIETIERQCVNAEWALKTVTAGLKAMFQNMSDVYLKERAADIGQVADRIMRNLVGAQPVDIAAIDMRVILVANELSPADASQINLERVKGFITDHGGLTSHTGIIARTLGIPAVMGLRNVTRCIKTDDVIIVDGISGSVVTNPEEQTLLEYEERQYRFEERAAEIARQCNVEAVTVDGHSLKIMGNIELSEEVVSVMDHGGDGIGLYRTEFQYLNRPSFPPERELFEKYKDVVEVIAPKPVVIRTLDINGDKTLVGNGAANEANPALGLRAIRYCLKRPDVFQTQLRAILRASAFGQIRILLPMISNLEEVLAAKKMLKAVATELDAEHVDYDRNIKLGVMIEVPSAVIIADLIAPEVDFFSIGTNDLIQYTLAIDRGNREVAHLYQPLHPAIIRLLKQVADTAHAHETPVYMCGEMAGDPLNVPLLLALGIEELSMNPFAIPAVKTMIRTIGLAEADGFLKEVLRQTSAAAIAKLVHDTYGDVIADKIYCQ